MADCARCDSPYDAYITDDGNLDVTKTKSLRAEVDKELHKEILSLNQKKLS